MVIHGDSMSHLLVLELKTLKNQAVCLPEVPPVRLPEALSQDGSHLIAVASVAGQAMPSWKNLPSFKTYKFQLLYLLSSENLPFLCLISYLQAARILWIH